MVACELLKWEGTGSSNGHCPRAGERLYLQVIGIQVEFEIMIVSEVMSMYRVKR